MFFKHSNQIDLAFDDFFPYFWFVVSVFTEITKSVSFETTVEKVLQKRSNSRFILGWHCHIIEGHSMSALDEVIKQVTFRINGYFTLVEKVPRLLSQSIDKSNEVTMPVVVYYPYLKCWHGEPSVHLWADVAFICHKPCASWDSRPGSQEQNRRKLHSLLKIVN